MCNNSKSDVILGGTVIRIDDAIRVAVKALNATGYQTITSCEGSLQPVKPFFIAYIRFVRTAPDALEQAATNAGFFLLGAPPRLTMKSDPSSSQSETAAISSEVLRRGIFAADWTLCKKRYEMDRINLFVAANTAFRRMLDDYLADRLDLSGEKYIHPLSFQYSFEMR